MRMVIFGDNREKIEEFINLNDPCTKSITTLPLGGDICEIQRAYREIKNTSLVVIATTDDDLMTDFVKAYYAYAIEENKHMIFI